MLLRTGLRFCDKLKKSGIKDHKKTISVTGELIVKSRKLVIIVSILLIILTSVVCGSSGNSDPDATPTPEPWVTHTSEARGLTLELPESWVVEDDETGGGNDTLNFANSKRALSANNFDGNAVGIVFIGNTGDFGGFDDPELLLNLFEEGFIGSAGEEGSLTITKETETLTIKGQQAASKTLEGSLDGKEGVYTLTTIINGENVAIVIAVDGSEGELTDTLAKVVKTIEVSRPQ